VFFSLFIFFSPSTRKSLGLSPGVLDEPVHLEDGSLPAPGLGRVALEVDAGSSHITAVVYRWDGTPDPRGLEKVVSVRADSSLSVGTPLQAGHTMAALVQHAIKDSKLRVHQLSIRATGGMRKLNKEQPAACAEVVQAIDHAVRGVIGDAKYSGMRIIEPAEEAALAWAATQFLSGGYKHKYDRSQYVSMAELGAFSIQVAIPEPGDEAEEGFEGNPSISALSEKSSTNCVVKVGPRRHVLRTLSWEVQTQSLTLRP